MSHAAGVLAEYASSQLGVVTVSKSTGLTSTYIIC